MTPDIHAVIQETIRLQRQTALLQLFTLGVILVCDLLIAITLVNIRKAIRANKAWSDANREWSEFLDRRASAGEAGTAETVEQGSVHEHATAESRDANNQVRD